MAKVEKLPEPKVFAPKVSELTGRINDLLVEYNGEISTAEAIGALEIVKLNLAKAL